MKKVISVLLVLVMVFSLTLPASAKYYKLDGSPIPIIAIFGDGEPIYNTEGEKIFHFKELLNMLGESTEGGLGEAVVNILTPFLIDGIVNDEWDPYYEALEKEIGELFSEARYDNNGENWNGSDVSTAVRRYMANNLTKDKKKGRGSYDAYDYQFWYDWRQDPMKTADEFHEYIQGVKKITGADKVGIIARCLGTTVVMAYIAKYGTDDIQGVSFNGSVAAGGEIISESISGKFVIDLNAINRMLTDLDSMETLNIDSFLTSSIDLAAKTLAVTGFEFNETEIYAKLLQGVTSALSLSTFFTWPGYWALVSEDDFEDALYYVFGEEGSEKRQEYSKLIDKATDYHENVMEQMNNILQKLKDDKVNVGVIAKYGFQIAPIVESRDLIADQFATINRSSFGATTSTVYDTFDDDYIAARTAEGKEKYISPDKQVDASTCFFPDSTWFTKGISHSKWTDFETSVLVKVVSADRQLTIDDFEYSQFIVYDNAKNEAFPMTAENCKTEAWDASDALDNPEDKHGKIFSVIYSLFSWLIDLFSFISGKLSK